MEYLKTHKAMITKHGELEALHENGERTTEEVKLEHNSMIEEHAKMKADHEQMPADHTSRK